MKLKRTICLAVVLLVGAACGTGSDDAEQPAAEEDAVPAVAELVCGEGGTAALAEDTVRATENGIRIAVDNQAGATEVFVRADENPDYNHGSPLEDGERTEIVATIPPGSVSVGCSISEDESASEPATLNVVDSDGLWTSPELPCESESEESRFGGDAVDLDASADPEDLIRGVVPGLESDDRLVRPGYPGTVWHGEPRVIIRGGETIGFAELWIEQGGLVLLRSCPGSDLGA